MALGSCFLFLLLGVLVLSEEGSGSHVWQPRGPIHVQSGGVLTLECTVPDVLQPGPVKWFKGEDLSRKLIYPNDAQQGRTTRKEKYSKTDFTIFLRNVTPEDAGTYYCVKLAPGGGQDLQSGDGTEVIVYGMDYRIPVAVSAVCILLILLLSGAVYSCRKKQRTSAGRSRIRHASRPEFLQPEKERTPHKNPNPNDIIYAKVELSNSAPAPKPRNLELVCEYATVQTTQRVTG
ncbi:signal-regulatory protein delta-like isoform X2 [Paroedura picta]|uniref:signal-regulatory protein delta-like isoform X2 n=1 Tax=Paroedura picta TaxID=143630 RepID=UPI0040576106